MKFGSASLPCAMFSTLFSSFSSPVYCEASTKASEDLPEPAAQSNEESKGLGEKGEEEAEAEAAPKEEEEEEEEPEDVSLLFVPLRCVREEWRFEEGTDRSWAGAAQAAYDRRTECVDYHRALN